MTGKIVLDIPPSENNPRNSEGAMLRLRNGSIFFVYSRFCASSDADNSGADLWGMYSDDEGETFKELGCIVDHEKLRAQNVMSVSLLRMQNGDIGLFYLIRHSETDMRMYIIRSSDEGVTWSDPIACIPNPGHYVVNNDRVVKLKSGRIYIPVALHRRSVRENGEVYFDSRSEFIGFYSDDDGVSWKESPGKCCLPGPGISTTGMQEPGIIETSEGVLFGWARTDLGRQYCTLSMDDGEHWTAPEPSVFTGPVSPLSIKHFSDGQYIAVWNPIPLYNGRSDRVGKIWNGGRTPLVLGLGKTIRDTVLNPIILEDDSMSGFCYTSIFPAEDNVILSYCAGGQDDGACLNRLRIRKIAYEELIQI